MKANEPLTVIPVENGFIVTNAPHERIGTQLVFESRSSLIEYLEHHFSAPKAAEVKEV